MKNRKINSYSLLRIIAILFVVIGHSAYLNLTSQYGGVNWILPDNTSSIYYSDTFSVLRYLAVWVYGFHMPLFFILSGAVYSLNRKNGETFGDLTIKKLKRLIVPFFVFGLFFMLPIKRLGLYYDNNSFLASIPSFLSGGESGHLWFLPSLFWCFVVFYIINYLAGLISSSSSKNYIIIITSGFIQLFNNYIPIDFFLFKQGMNYIFWFSLGFVFNGQWMNSISLIRPRIKIMYFVLLFMVIIIDIKLSVLNTFFRVLIISFWLFLLCSLIESKKFVNSGFIRLLERNCMYIYLFHDPLEYVVLRISFLNNWIISGAGTCLYGFLRTIGVIVISILLGEGIRFVKKIAQKRFPQIYEKGVLKLL